MQFQDKFYPTVLQHSLQKFRADNLFCDVKLVVDGEEFQAHKLILSAASPYFRVMFNAESSFIESKQERVILQGIDRIAFSDIIKFVYSSNLEINDDNVYVLMEAADLLQFYALKSFISFYLQSSMEIDNCLQLYVMASLHHYHDLATNAFRFLLTNFSKIVERNEFLDVPIETILEIMSSKFLDVANEEMLHKVIIKWIEKDTNSRKKHLDSLVSKLNLNLFSIKSLTEIKNNPLTTTKIQLKIEEIINCKLMRASMANLIDMDESLSFHKSRYNAEKSVIFAIGGESSGKALQSIECFTLGYDKWRYVVPEYIIKSHETKYTNVLPPLRYARYYAASTYDAYNVYVIGGRNSTTLLDKCEVFHIKTNQWDNFHQLPEKLFAAGAGFLEGELVVVGGCSEEGVSNKVWKLDKAQTNWTLMPSLDFPRYFHGTIALGGYLYVLGGFDSKTEEALQTCLRFDPGSNKWFRISSMGHARAKFGCAAADNFIYVFGGISNGNYCLKSVERYNTLTDEWTYESSMTIPRHSFSVAVSDREIYCLGGTDGIHFLHTVHKFSLRTKRWHCVHPLQISRLASAGAALLVPYSASRLN